ncbi:MAG: 23S rRNA (uracil(1939)-C(5))-methyltransferase RlmD [Planctomycetes bacterium]|nr:23S rRNA (uracil(1939)-C(5))-methyltransferase RlmD [Planctomycetota bacterium]
MAKPRRNRTSKNRPHPGQRSAPGAGQAPVEMARPGTREPVFCPHFGPCGGCQHLDMHYDAEVARKARALEEMVRAEPGLKDARVLEPLAAAEPLFYRIALKVPFGTSQLGPTCGFFRPGTHSIVDLRACAIQHPLLTEILLRARSLSAELRVPIYQEYRHSGLLRHLLGRVAPGTGQALVGLVVRKGGAPPIRRLAQALFEEFRPRGLIGVVENVNPERTNLVAGERSKRLCGTPILVEEQDGLRFRSSITSFVQVNAAQAAALFAEVLRQLGDLAGRHVCDLYSGFGPIALRLARAGALVSAIERNREAVRDGAAAADENGLRERMRFLAADALAGLRRAASGGIDALVVDPPRRGLQEPLIDLICDLPLHRMVYVSCNPETHLRDLALLARAFDVVELRPVDLFPRTAHLEVVTLLERR